MYLTVHSHWSFTDDAGAAPPVGRAGKHIRPARIDWIDVIHALPPISIILQELLNEPPLR